MATTMRGRGGYSDGDTTHQIRAVIAGLDIPFLDLVALLVKLSLASIPAMIILVFFGAVVVGVVGGIGGALIHR